MSIWYFLDKIEIYLRFEIRKVFITVPAYDIYDKECFIMSNGKSNIIRVFKYKYELVDDKIEKVILVNCFNNMEIHGVRISYESYMEVSRIVNRSALLREPYPKIQGGDVSRKFIYHYEDKGFARVREVSGMREWFTGSSSQDKILKILHWVCVHAKHKGDVILPDSRTGESLLELISRNEGVLNCRGLAILTNMMCMAAQIPSRFIVCMQKEEQIDDCHVVTIAYDRENKKWIMIDPSYELYCMNENGLILSLEEIRYRLMQDIPVYINQEANITGVQLNPNLYLRNLVKKIYRFQSPIEITSDCDYVDNLIELVPRIKCKEYSICDPSKFWALPD